MQTSIETDLTRHIWEHWKINRTKPSLSWLEVHKLAEQLTKKCRENFADYREIDLASLIDPQLNYYENLDALHVQFHQLGFSLVDFEQVGEGTEKLRQKYLALSLKYRRIQKRLKRYRLRNRRLKAELEKKKHHHRKG